MDFTAVANEIGTREPVTVEFPRPDAEPVKLTLRAPTGSERLRLHAEASEILAQIAANDGRVNPVLAAETADVAARWTAKLADPAVEYEQAASVLHAVNGVNATFLALVKMVVDLPEDAEEGGGVEDADRFPDDAAP